MTSKYVDKYLTNGPYGRWEVTTEGDCEGRTIKHLGTFDGFVDDIALRLADQSYYSLCFRLAKTLDLYPCPTKTEVNVSVDIDSKTWDLKGEARVAWWKQFLKGRDVIVEGGTSYASVLLRLPNSKVEEVRRKAALAKLTPEERKLLGL